MVSIQKCCTRARLHAARIVLLAVLAVAPNARATDPPATPRPISAAEEAAVHLAVQYLQDGPRAWVGALSPDGPWGGLDPGEAEAEIGVRAGPREAHWQLQTLAPGEPAQRAVFSIDYPSGLDETLTLDLENSGDTWTIGNLRSMAEPWPEPEDLLLAGPTSGVLPQPASGPPARSAGNAAAGAAVAIVAALLLLAARRPGPPRLATGFLVAGFACAAILLWACGGGAGSDKAVVDAGPSAASQPGEPGPSLVRLGALLPVRRALALGAAEEEVARLLATVPAAGPQQAAVSLWLAERSMQRGALDAAAAALAERPDPDPVPLGALLRARLAFSRSDAADAALFYDRVTRLGPDHDGIRMEAANALGTLGDLGESEVAYDLLVGMGSRLAHVYYGATVFALLRDDVDTASAMLRRAWMQQPMERRELLANPFLAHLVARPELFPLFDLSSPREPLVGAAGTGRHPLDLPAGSEARVCGAGLQVEIGAARLAVPGGSALAPAEAPVVGADAERRRDEAEALAHLPALLAEGRGIGSLANPRRLAELMAAGSALAGSDRWQDVATLTAALDGADLDPVPGELVMLRASALGRLDRGAEARRLLIRLAQRDLEKHQRDPGTLYALAELVAADGEYDLALKLVRKGDSLSSSYYRDEGRLRRIEMEQRLAADPSSLETKHFRLVYPRSTGERYPRQLGTVLEEEYVRLSRWIPPSGGPPMEIQLYPVEEFLRAYAGSALVVGIYDGVVRVPFADLRSLDPQLVAILSHEVAHAMTSRATDDRAPHWFQEGLAEHVQMSQDWVNPYPDLQETSRVLSFPVIEPILSGFAQQQLIELAYGEAAWVAHYLEARHGAGSFRRMMEAFRQGDDTAEALQRVLGMSPAELDRAVVTWAVDAAPRAWPTQVRRYDREYDLPFERSNPQAPGNDRQLSGGSSFRAPVAERSQLQAWHAGYASRVAPFKRALAPLVDDLSAGRVGAHREACVDLGRQVTALLADVSTFACPTPGIRDDLRHAFESFRDMSTACAASDGFRTVSSYRRAERDLDAVAGRLRPLGLRP